eukprot:47828-Eustigmatos_ZCMA.PRE.1
MAGNYNCAQVVVLEGVNMETSLFSMSLSGTCVISVQRDGCIKDYTAESCTCVVGKDTVSLVVRLCHGSWGPIECN